MRPTRDAMLMEMAKVVATRSTCTRLQVGCVVSIEGRVLTMGYNGTPAGMPHCDHTCTCGLFEQHGAHASQCPAGPCTKSVHDAANAIAFAARFGVKLTGAELHSTDSPCYECAKLIINSGITRVVWERTYRDESGIMLLKSAGIDTEQWV